MKHLALLLAALFAFAAMSMAEVSNGNKYKCGPNGTVTANVSVDATANTANVTFTRDGDESSSTTGSPGGSGGDTVEDTGGTMKETNADGEELECRVSDGKWQYKNSNGDWIDAGSPRKKIAHGSSSSLTTTHVAWPDEEIISLPIVADRDTSRNVGG